MQPPVVNPTQRHRAFIWMLITVPLAGAGVDMFLPSLPAMTKAMDTTSFAVQGTVLIYMGAYGIAQIIFGPLVDRWGRRVPSAIGAAVMAVASVVIANADSIELVLVMRTIQGIGGAVTVVSARSIVADCYDGDARARAANWMTIAWACGPVLSPAIGGYLQEWFGWHATFWVLGGWAALSTVTPLVLLPETRRTKPSGQLRQVFAPYRHIAVDRIYVSAALAMGCLISITYTFEVLAPFYVQIDLKHSPVYYGHLQLIMGALWLAGLLTNRMLTHMSNDFIRTLIAGLAAACISGAMIGVDSASHFSVMWLAVPAGAAYFLGATYWPILYAVCLGRFPYAGGASNALVSGLFSLISGGFALMGTFLHSSTAWPMWSIFLLTLSLSMLIVIIFLRPVLTKGAARLEGIDLRQSASVSNQG